MKRAGCPKLTPREEKIIREIKKHPTALVAIVANSFEKDVQDVKKLYVMTFIAWFYAKYKYEIPLTKGQQKDLYTVWKAGWDTLLMPKEDQPDINIK